MSHIHHQNRKWKEYSDLINGVSKLFIGVATAAALMSTGLYCWNVAKIEQISHRNLTPWWTSLLLLLPVFVQLAVFVRLRKRLRQAIFEDELRAYFSFYFWRMAPSLAVYTLLWLFYVGVFWLEVRASIILAVSWLPLVGIILLMWFVIHTTFLITRTSFTDNRSILAERDVRLSYSSIRTALEDSPSNSPVDRIRQWLKQQRDSKIHSLVEKKQIQDLDIGHLTEALNLVIRSRSFYDQIHPRVDGLSHPSEHKLPTEIEEYNRSFLNRHLLGDNKELSDVVRQGKELTQEEKLIKQDAQRKGLAKFPFYTMVFFFSIFLCIAYLFGFAYAFDDRYVQLNGRKQQVALFMNDDTREDVQWSARSRLFTATDIHDAEGLVRQLQNSDDDLSVYLRDKFTETTRDLLKNNHQLNHIPEPVLNAMLHELNTIILGESLYDQNRFAHVSLRAETKRLQAQKKLNSDEMIRFNRLLLEDAYPFHITRSQQLALSLFRSESAYEQMALRKIFYFKSGGAGIPVASDVPEMDNRTVLTNKSGLDALSERIKQELSDGKRVRIELVGRADDHGVKAAQKSDSTAKSEDTYGSNFELASARIKAVRYELQNRIMKTLPNESAEIQWLELSLSNDPTFPSSIVDFLDGESTGTSPVLNYHSKEPNLTKNDIPTQRLRDLNARVNTERVAKALRSEYQLFWKRINDITKAGKVNESSLTDLYDKLEEWKNFKVQLREEDAGRKRDEIDRELYRFEDLLGSQRSVEVWLYSAPSFEESDPPQYKRMALMDYLYFAMYTITTTGYGDIKPITPYAKFLCTIANVIEVFFIVVFFNTLLSVRRSTPDGM